MQAMGQDVDLRVLPGEKLPIHPDFAIELIEWNAHPVTKRRLGALPEFGTSGTSGVLIFGAFTVPSHPERMAKHGTVWTDLTEGSI